VAGRTPRAAAARAAAGTKEPVVNGPAVLVEAGVWRLDLPWTRPPLSLNDTRQGNWRGRARKVRDIRQTAAWLGRTIPGRPFTRVRVTLHYQPRDRRVRDSENPIPTLKALADGLVDAGVVPDDRPELMVKDMPVIHPAEKGQPGTVWLIVAELAPEHATTTRGTT
jgi:crossover junction endodeoxyribonuclease RusA